VTDQPPSAEPDQPVTAEADESTVGTGTYVAIGCTVTMLLILLLGIALSYLIN
jgi:hypothetical protein